MNFILSLCVYEKKHTYALSCLLFDLLFYADDNCFIFFLFFDCSQDGMTSNDDRILATCLSLCKSNSKDQGSLSK